ncbi:hypothetical protein [Streptomyces sp. NPDC021622]|uniref:hypothetical protein n=1 Tax=Streptomyces sp. NPDC021622 TaxID=3155013 RepID=UPI0033C29DFA
MLRLRLTVVGCPRRALALTDTPRPNCSRCSGLGAIEHFYGDSEYVDSDWEPCSCWNELWCLLILPLPRPKPPAGFSDEPPF